jgi:RND family efflux transporter MFP subunit
MRSLSPLAAGLLMLGAMLLMACSPKPPPHVATALVMARPVHPASGVSSGQLLRYPIEASPRYQNALSFRVAGHLVERNVRLGDQVRTGQVLARLDAADAQHQAASARAMLDAAEHRLVFARQQLERDTAQAAQSLISESALEQTQDSYSAAVAERERLVDQYAIARNTLAYHTLLADHAGVITSEDADTGQYVSAGQAVFGVAWSGDIDAQLDAAAGDLARIAVGQSAVVTFGALPGRRLEARVREIAPAADARSRSYRVKLTLIGTAADVRLGMTGDAVLRPLDQHDSGVISAPVFEVPATAVFHDGDQPAVWVVRGVDSTLELRPVSVRAYTGGSALIATGLSDGDQVVQAGVHTVYAGQHVKPVPPLFADEADGRDSGDAGAGGPR